MAAIFETETCSRCGGSGNYSWCQRFGSTCFKCAGRGYTLSKRGAAAQQHYHDSFPQKAPQDLVVGDRFRTTGMTAGFEAYSTIATVIEAPVQSQSSASHFDQATGQHVRTFYIDVATIDRYKQRTVHGMFPTSKVTIIPDEQERARLQAAALAYQATLTKTGKLPKRQAKRNFDAEREA